MSNDRFNRLTKKQELFQLLVTVGGTDIAHEFLANFFAATDRLDGPHIGSVVIRVGCLVHEPNLKAITGGRRCQAICLEWTLYGVLRRVLAPVGR